MSINIEQAVEAAAKALYENSPQNDGTPWEEADTLIKFRIREVVLPIVDAAVNTIAAQAWQQGFDAAYKAVFNYGPDKNPYVEEEA